MKSRALQQSLRSHVNDRIDEFYPATQCPMPDGGIMPELREMVRASADAAIKSRPPESAFDLKQSITPDGLSTEVEQLFQGVRPQLVVDEASVNNAMPQEMQTDGVRVRLDSCRRCENVEYV